MIRLHKHLANILDHNLTEKNIQTRTLSLHVNMSMTPQIVLPFSFCLSTAAVCCVFAE